MKKNWTLLYKNSQLLLEHVHYLLLLFFPLKSEFMVTPTLEAALITVPHRILICFRPRYTELSKGDRFCYSLFTLSLPRTQIFLFLALRRHDSISNFEYVSPLMHARALNGQKFEGPTLIISSSRNSHLSYMGLTKKLKAMGEHRKHAH